MTKRILCLGNNTEDTDRRARILAKDAPFHGLLSELDGPISRDAYSKPGYYHSSVYDLAFSRLLDIANEFDQVIMLDQPKHIWSHPDAFYQTVRLMETISTDRLFQDPGYQINIAWAQDLVQTNRSFCIFPFIELLVYYDSTTVCCRSDKPITKLKDLEDFGTDPHYADIRKKMLAGERLPDRCGSCYDLEDKGILSARQQETVEWINRLDIANIDDLLAIKKPAYYEIRASNKCNLLCRTCEPGSSHLIKREYKKLGWLKNPVEKYTKGFEIIDFENLRKLYVSGGEPTVMQEFYQFLDRCIQQGKTDFEILINTNGQKVSDRFIAQLAEFDNFQFIFSVDALGDANHYIRWPSDWDRLIDNWRTLADMGHKISVNTTVSIYNIDQLDQLFAFVDDQFPNTLIHCTVVSGPVYLQPWINPNIDNIRAGLARVKQMPCYHNDPLLASTIDGLYKHFVSHNQTNRALLADFFRFNDALDLSRSIKLADYLPALERARGLI